MFQLLFSGARDIARVQLVLRRRFFFIVYDKARGRSSDRYWYSTCNWSKDATVNSLLVPLASWHSFRPQGKEWPLSIRLARKNRALACLQDALLQIDGGSETGAPRSLTNSAKLLSLERVPARIPTHSPFPRSPARCGGSGVWLWRLNNLALANVTQHSTNSSVVIIADFKVLAIW